MRLVLLRIGLLLLAALLTSEGLALLTGVSWDLALASTYSALYFIPVNILCLLILRGRLHREGTSLRALAGFDRSRLGRDLLLGLLWQFVLFVPFFLAISLTMLLLFGVSDYSGAFERTFAPDPGSLEAVPLPLFTAAAALVALLFPITNAPTEELYYRGYAQGWLLRSGRAVATAIVVPSLAFGAQHILLAPTAPAALVYFVAFTLWGLGAALIRQRTGRLMPLIFAHLFTNAFSATVPLVLVLSL